MTEIAIVSATLVIITLLLLLSLVVLKLENDRTKDKLTGLEKFVSNRLKTFDTYLGIIFTRLNPDLKVMLTMAGAVVPQQAHSTDAGYDVFSPNEFTIYPGQDCMIQLGWSCSFAPGWAMIFKDKSGVASKLKLSVESGVVDSAYRGPVTVHFRSMNTEAIHITKGQKIAQFMMVPVAAVPVQLVDTLDETERGEGGFGSTGTHLPYEDDVLNTQQGPL